MNSLLLARFFLPAVCFVLSASISLKAEPLTLKRAVELAIRRSPAAAELNAEDQRAVASLQEARNQYLPQLLIGSGLGDSWGYPLSLEGAAPSLVNINAQSALLNPALRDFVRAARSDLKATQEASKDRRNQIIQDTVLTYLELVKWEQLIDRVREQHQDASRMERVVEERIQQGVDSPQSMNQARLVTARATLHLSQAKGAVDVLESRLSQLTGLPVSSIQTAPDSVPSLPEPPSEDTVAAGSESNPAISSAEQHALAQDFRARAEHRSLWPSIDFASQYAVLAKFNNWVQFFPRAFQRNNATVGVVIRFPVFNAGQKAHAEAADADALRARQEVEATKNQVSQETLRLERAVEQLAAARKVSQLEYEIAKSNVDALVIRMNSGSAGVHDAALARTEMFEKYNALQDAGFELSKARIGLLRTTGELESWVEQSK
ncbi:MAG: TolC family protein [Acidobacteria bacterium]|nr:TolC family protein [Acidobacteriota bacterium]